MGEIASQITSITIVYSTVYSDVDQRKHQSSASLAFVRGIHRGPVNFPAQMASNAENVFIWWRHHAVMDQRKMLVWPLILCSASNVAGNPFSHTSGPQQNGQYFSGDIFNCVFVNKNCVLIQFSLEFSFIENMPALVWKMGYSTEQATSHYLNQCWKSSLMHIYLNELRKHVDIWQFGMWCCP